MEYIFIIRILSVMCSCGSDKKNKTQGELSTIIADLGVKIDDVVWNDNADNHNNCDFYLIKKNINLQHSEQSKNSWCLLLSESTPHIYM